MNYAEISKEPIGYLYKAYNSLKKSGIDPKLFAFAYLRIAQLNGCAYCSGFHAQELRDLGVEQIVIDRLPGWRLSSYFDERQKVVLGWTETITLMKENIGTLRAEVAKHFAERELVDITAGISLMNALTRLRITLDDNH